MLTNGQAALDFDGDSWQAPSITVTVPPNKTLVVVSSRCSDVQERENLFYGLEGFIARDPGSVSAYGSSCYVSFDNESTVSTL